MDSKTELTGRSTIALIHGGQDRRYLVHVPQHAAANGVPLLLELHGRGIDPARFDRLTGFGSLAEEMGFVLAMPNALGEIWNDGRSHSAKWTREPDDVGYLAAVIDDVTARLPIDTRRIYVVGMSNGAVMAGRLACEFAERIAAVAQVAGTAGLGIAAGYRSSRPVPILNIHGVADSYVLYEGGVRHSLLSRGALRRASGPSVAVNEWAKFWVAANGAFEGPVMSALPPDTTIRTWHGASPESDVAFYRIEGGGHTWPGSRFTLPRFLFGRTSATFDASRRIWEFFEAHTR